MKLLNSLFLLVAGLISTTAWCVDPPFRVPADLERYRLALPNWADPFGNFTKPDVFFMNIRLVMQELSLDRAQAVELQNNLHDRMEAKGAAANLVAEFLAALSEIRAGKFERLDRARIKQAPFVVVFDLDETLYDQKSSPKGCEDAKIALPDGKERLLKFNPGAVAAIDAIRSLGGEVVIFSANRDKLTMENLENWKLGSETMATTTKVAGILTNSHLIFDDGRDLRRDGPLTTASKDLRIVDESLSKVILVDDNPRLVFQARNHRQIKKFKADLFCGSREPGVRQAFNQQLVRVVAEIKESVEFMRAARVSFAQAYLPYSSLGRLAVSFLQEGNSGLTEPQAVAFLRRHPEVVDEKF